MNKLLTYKPGKRRAGLLKSKRRKLTLIEVLIAFSIIVMSLFPLLYPHVFIFRQQSLYTKKIEMNHAVNIMFGAIYRRLYQQEISLGEILENKEFIIDEDLLKEAGFHGKPGFTGSYHFNLIKRKNDEDNTKTAYLLDLIFDMKLEREEKKKSFHFSYKIFIFQETEQPASEGETDES